ncbi:MAG TPA: universal stress protein [Pyrinomonadaceae bacterium]|nr:universal stress protein [Pyrinomonadaceae bacterium]
MINIERILCPVTLPPESDEALRYAVSLARTFNAELFLCHCAGPPSLVNFLTDTNDHQSEQKELVEALTRVIGPVGHGSPPWDVIVTESGKDTGETIVQTARQQRIDLIVMRSRRSPVVGLLGSTAEHVSRNASCPVLVVRMPSPKDEPEQREAGFRAILVAHDFSSSSELALSYGLSIAQKRKADLYLIHVLPEQEEDEPEIAWGPTALSSAYLHAARRLQDSVPEEVYRKCRVTHVVRWGKPYREILAYAREQDADLICIGALGSDFGYEALFGSNADRVLRQATCPVLVARPLQPASRVSLLASEAAGDRVSFTRRAILKGVENARSHWPRTVV